MNYKIVAESLIKNPFADTALGLVDPTPTFMDKYLSGGQILTPNELPIADGERIIPYISILLGLPFRRRIMWIDAHHHKPTFPVDNVSYHTRWISMDGVQPQPFTQLTTREGVKQTLWTVHGRAGTKEAWAHPSLPWQNLHAYFIKGDDPECDSHSGIKDALGRTTGAVEYLKAPTFNTQHLVVAGNAFTVCAGMTAVDALEHFAKVTIVRDACEGIEMQPGDMDKYQDFLIGEGVNVAFTHELVEQAKPYLQQTRAYWAKHPLRVYDPKTMTEVTDPAKIAEAYAHAGVVTP